MVDRIDLKGLIVSKESSLDCPSRVPAKHKAEVLVGNPGIQIARVHADCGPRNLLPTGPDQDHNGGMLVPTRTYSRGVNICVPSKMGYMHILVQIIFGVFQQLPFVSSVV